MPSFVFSSATPETLKRVSTLQQGCSVKKTILVYAMGSSFDNELVKSVTDTGVLCLLADPTKTRVTDVEALEPTGIVISDYPNNNTDQYRFDKKMLGCGIPVLGIGQGWGLWARHFGFKVAESTEKHYSVEQMTLHGDCHDLFHGCGTPLLVFQNNGIRITNDRRLKVLGSTHFGGIAAASWYHLYGMKIHPEVPLVDGTQIMRNFILKVCDEKNHRRSLVKNKISAAA